MAATYITVDRSKALGAALTQAASDARRFAHEIGALKTIMDSMYVGADYSVLEAQFGLPAGQGASLQYMIASLKSGLDAIPQFATLPDWLGQV